MSRSRKKRGLFNPLSLAFLDVMSCGFGAVVLLFLILDHTAREEQGDIDPTLAAEVALLDTEVQEGEENLVRLRNTLADISLEVVEAQGLAERIQSEIDDFMLQLAELEGTTLASEESVEQLRADIEALEEDLMRLQASGPDDLGTDARAFLGDGQRQYLSGMYMGGNRILVLLDVSASMLDESLVNIIRTRNMDAEARRKAPKWQRAVRISEWIVSQLPVASQYQVYAFNDQVFPVLPGTEGQWLEVADQDELDQMVRAIGDLAPERGNNLQRAFQAVQQMSPPPDNVYLITDSLPTQSNNTRDTSGLVTPRQRLEMYWQAVESLPRNIPVNTILLPMEGDPSAPAVFWELAIMSQGSFITPSKDWP